LNIEYRKKFLKELSKIPLPYRTNIENFVFDYLPTLKSITEANHIEKMKGYHEYYKVRFGSYRVGLRYSDEILTLERVLHRKEIYKYFP
jgi:mRNA interferase RelE/StbE